MKKWMIWLLLVVALVIIGLFFLNRPKEAMYDRMKVVQQDLTTYYSFSGNVEAKDKQSLVSTSMFQVNEVLVEEGQYVEKGDIILTTSQGMKFEASIAGEVATIYVTEGQLITTGAPLVDITDYQHLQVKVKVDEYNISPIEIGKEVTIHVNALNQDVLGKISHMTKEAQISNGIAYFIATIDIEEIDNVYVGMSSEVKLINKSVADAIVLPIEAIQFNSDNVPYVYYEDNRGEVMSKEVSVGVSDGVYVQILSGIDLDEEILIPKVMEYKTPFDMLKHSNK